MKRKEFLKNLFLASSVLVVPKIDLTQYEKIYLHQSFIRGFQYYEGEKLIHIIREGDALEFQREPENKYDSSAIAILYQGQKLGYLPRESNEILAKLLDSQAILLHGEVLNIHLDVASWEKIFFALYFLKPKKECVHEKAYQKLKQIEKPIYQSI